MQYLEHFLDIASKTDNLAAQAEACRNLGVVHFQRGDYEKATAAFERNFDIALSLQEAELGDHSSVATCRIYLGLAASHARIKSHLDRIQTDLPSLLTWKIQGDLPGPSGRVGKGSVLSRFGPV